MGETCADERASYLRSNLANLSKGGVIELLEIERQEGRQAVYAAVDQISRLTEENERLRKLLKDAQSELLKHATHMETDCPGDVPEPCGQWCDICNRHIDDANHALGHKATCIIDRIQALGGQ